MFWETSERDGEGCIKRMGENSEGRRVSPLSQGDSGGSIVPAKGKKASGLGSSHSLNDLEGLFVSMFLASNC